MEEDEFGGGSASFVEYRVFEHWMIHYRGRRLEAKTTVRDSQFRMWRQRYRDIVDRLVSEDVVAAYWFPRSAVGRILPSRVRHLLIAILAYIFDRMVREQEGSSG